VVKLKICKSAIDHSFQIYCNRNNNIIPVWHYYVPTISITRRMSLFTYIIRTSSGFYTNVLSFMLRVKLCFSLQPPLRRHRCVTIFIYFVMFVLE
jgi:hypothetical protein